jgi:hypothetical protein
VKADKTTCAVKLAIVLIIFIILVFLTRALTLYSTRLALFNVWCPLEMGCRRLPFWSTSGRLGWERVVLFVALTIFTTLGVHGCNFLGSQEATTGTTRTTHGMIMPRLMQVGFPSLRSKTEGIFKLLPCKTSLKNPVELLRIDVQRRFFCLRSRYKLRRLLVLLGWLRHLRRC